MADTITDDSIRAIVLGGLLDLEDVVPRYRLEARADAITRALMGVYVRGTVVSGTIEPGAVPRSELEDTAIGTVRPPERNTRKED